MNEPSMGRSGSTMFVRARTERTLPPPIMREMSTWMGPCRRTMLPPRSCISSSLARGR